jgi:hypothetical protein
MTKSKKTYEERFPYAVVDEETPYVVARYETQAQAEFHIDQLHKYGGTVMRQKVERGGYGIDGPQG